MAFRKLAHCALFAHAAQAALQYKGADWSSVVVLERDGTEYKDFQGTVKPLETILSENGVNIVRQRVVRILWNFSGTRNLLTRALSFHSGWPKAIMTSTTTSLWPSARRLQAWMFTSTYTFLIRGPTQASRRSRQVGPRISLGLRPRFTSTRST